VVFEIIHPALSNNILAFLMEAGENFIFQINSLKDQLLFYGKDYQGFSAGFNRN
jgi:hypothetical protein